MKAKYPGTDISDYTYVEDLTSNVESCEQPIKFSKCFTKLTFGF